MAPRGTRCRDDRVRSLKSQDPEDAIEDTTVVRPWHAARLVRQHQLNGRPLVVGEFTAHDSSPQFGDLNHGSTAGLNGSSEVHRMSAFGGAKWTSHYHIEGLLRFGLRSAFSNPSVAEW